MRLNDMPATLLAKINKIAVRASNAILRPIKSLWWDWKFRGHPRHLIRSELYSWRVKELLLKDLESKKWEI